MPQGKTPSVLKSRRLSGKSLRFLLRDEDDTLKGKAATAKSGRAAKTLVKEGPLRITLVAMKKGTELAQHQVDGPVSIQSLRGRAVIVTDDREYELPSGELLVLERGVAHTARAANDCAILITMSFKG